MEDNAINNTLKKTILASLLPFMMAATYADSISSITGSNYIFRAADDGEIVNFMPYDKKDVHATFQSPMLMKDHYGSYCVIACNQSVYKVHVIAQNAKIGKSDKFIIPPSTCWQFEAQKDSYSVKEPVSHNICGKPSLIQFYGHAGNL